MDFTYVGLIMLLGAASVLMLAGCARLKEKK